MVINKSIAFKDFLSQTSLFFFPILPFFLALALPTALSVHTGKQDFLLYRKGFISATWSQPGGGISSAIQATERERERERHRSLHTHTPNTHLKQPLQTCPSKYSMSPEHDDKMLANVRLQTSSGAQVQQAPWAEPNPNKYRPAPGLPTNLNPLLSSRYGFFFFFSSSPM